MRAVVADDDRATATIVAKVLTQLSLSVEVAHDGNEAWELLMKSPAPALAVIDWMMPGIDGLELCRRIKRESALAVTHVILLTAKNDRQDVVTALGAGADDYVVKPFKFEELRTRVLVGVRIATLQERVVKSVAELQAAKQGDGAGGGTASQAGWLKLARDGVARSGRYRRSLGELVQGGREEEVKK